MKARRVVTGHSPAGKAVFASDESVESVDPETMPGAEFILLWGADRCAHFPDDGKMPAIPQYFPPIGGFRVWMFTVAPESQRPPAGTGAEDVRAELEEKLPGLAQYMEADQPGMHTTDTVDFEYVISGRCLLELDDGVTRELGPGDSVVQNGTRHRWRNPYDEPCTMIAFLAGARHDKFAK